jgi:hypothetical protein
MVWKKITIESKKIINEYLKNKFLICDYNFTNLLLWSEGDNIEFFENGELLFLRGNYLGKNTYFMPVSKTNDISNVKFGINKILSLGEEIHLIPEEWKNILSDFYIFTEKEDNFDYMYNIASLITLEGRKYNKKKNKLNFFKKNYDFKYHKITKENISRVNNFQNFWCLKKECEKNRDLFNENLGIKYLIDNYSELDIKGGFIEVDGKVIAYSFGEVINEDIVVIHIEKADENYKGSYQAINAIFLEKEWQGYTFVNREDDAGILGIRIAKSSYLPEKMLKKYSLISVKI